MDSFLYWAKNRDRGSRKKQFIGSRDYMWPPGHAIARSVGLGVSINEQLWYKTIQATVRA